MTDRTIKVSKFPTGWGFADCFPNGLTGQMDDKKLPNIDLYTLDFQLKQLNERRAKDISLSILKKFAKRYRTKVVVVLA